MSRKQSISITLPNPCTQSWDEMTPSGDGRFCAHCEKTVIDFTTWSDAALHQFFSKKDNKVCGRFMPMQLNRNINIPAQPHSRLYRMVVALGLTVIFAHSGETQARPRPPLTGQYSLFAAPDTTYKDGSGTHFSVSGKLTAVGWWPKADYAVIHAYRNNKLMGSTSPDSFGNYAIQSLPPGLYNIVVFAGGTTYVTEKAVDLSQKDAIADFRVVLGGPMAGEPKIGSYPPTRKEARRARKNAERLDEEDEKNKR